MWYWEKIRVRTDTWTLPLIAALAGDGPRFRGARSPVFGRKSHTPERRPRGRKFQANFGFAGAHRAKESDVALLLFLRALVLQQNFAAAGKPRFHQHQCAVRV